MSRNIVFEGWLTKSPPSKRIWRTKWRRRWFALRQSGDLPGQYFLDYYADRNCRRLKGTINMDLCEQVDAGLHMERAGNGAVEPKLRGSVFTILTHSRTYHLEADCEEDMMKWVDIICRICGLRSTEDTDEEIRPYEMSTAPASPDDDPESADGTGPYISISDCITGVRAQARPVTTFTFDNNMVITVPPGRRPELMRAQDVILPPAQSPRAGDVALENGATPSGDQDNATGNNWYVTKSFTRVPSKTPNGSTNGPPVPPRPPKSLSVASGRSRNSRENVVYMRRTCQNDGYRVKESVQVHKQHPVRFLGGPRPEPNITCHAPSSPPQPRDPPAVEDDLDEETLALVASYTKEPPHRLPYKPTRARLTPFWVRVPPAPLPTTDEEDEEEDKEEVSSAPTPPPHALVVPRSAPAMRRSTSRSPARMRMPIATLPTTDEEDEEAASPTQQQLGRSLGGNRPVPDVPRHAPPSPARLCAPPSTVPTTEGEEEMEASLPTTSQYYNLPALPLSSPPAVDRALKPRHASIGHINNLLCHSLQLNAKDIKADVLQYLDLDLPASSPSQSKSQDAQKKLEVFHGKSQSCEDPETESAYKTVDFLKTEAFNITRQDAEASRSNQN